MLINLYLKKILKSLWRSEDTQIAYHQELIQKYRSSSLVSLNHKEFKVYSQNGEDGIIDEIFRRIGFKNKEFFEFGAGDGLQNNTTYLLFQGWKGVWVEPSEKGRHKLEKIFKRKVADGSLRIYSDFITPENVDQKVSEYKLPSDIDIISIDVDSVDYYIWESLEAIKPRLVVIEYNSTFPISLSMKVPKDHKVWNGTFIMGANLRALYDLGKIKGYSLVATDICGVNSFFVRNDLLGDKFDYAGNLEVIYNTPKYYLKTYAGHPAGF